MTPDDLWVCRLQDRADEVVPDVPADAAIVVRRGRRRRTARRVSVIWGSAILAIGIALGAAPAVRLLTDDVHPAVRPEDREVVIDTTDGTITLPLDRYALTEGEQAEVLHASALAMHECAADRGYVISDPMSMSLLNPGTGPVPVGDRRLRGVVDAVRGDLGVRRLGRRQRQRLRGLRRRLHSSSDRRAAGHHQRAPRDPPCSSSGPTPS